MHLPGLIRTASHPDIQKIRIIAVFFENVLHWQFQVETNSTNGGFKLHIYLRKNKTLTHNSLYVLDNWGKIYAIKRCSTFTLRKCLPQGPGRLG